MRVFTLTLGTVLALALSAAAMAAAMQEDEVMTQNGYEYVCTGVGMHARQDLRWQTFPLKLVFANRQGDYLSGISVQLIDAGGGTLIDTRCNGPWLLAKLDAGNYKANVVTGAGLAKTVDVAVPASGQKQVVVTFDQD